MEVMIKNLSYSYDNKIEALKSIDLEINKGELIGIVGNTGSGKSTLLKHLNGILRSDKGYINILGRAINKKSKNLKGIRKKVGIVFQFPEEQLFAENIREDIYFGPRNFGFEVEEIEENLKELKKILNIDESILSKSSGELSGGEKRRASIVSVLISKPNILVLDEPTIGLDYENRTKLLGLIEKLNRIGTTVIIVSHDLHSFWHLLKRLVILEGGKKVFDGDRIELLKNRGKLNTYFLPDYIEKLDDLGILEGNEEKALNKEDALKLIIEKFGGDLDG